MINQGQVDVRIELPEGGLKKKKELRNIYDTIVKNVSHSMEISVYDVRVKFIEQDENYTYLMNTGKLESKAPSPISRVDVKETEDCKFKTEEEKLKNTYLSDISIMVNKVNTINHLIETAITGLESAKKEFYGQKLEHTLTIQYINTIKGLMETLDRLNKDLKQKIEEKLDVKETDKVEAEEEKLKNIYDQQDISIIVDKINTNNNLIEEVVAKFEVIASVVDQNKLAMEYRSVIKELIEFLNKLKIYVI